MFLPAAHSILGHWIPSKHRGRHFAFAMSGMYAGAATAMVVVPTLSTSEVYQRINEQVLHSLTCPTEGETLSWAVKLVAINGLESSMVCISHGVIHTTFSKCGGIRGLDVFVVFWHSTFVFLNVSPSYTLHEFLLSVRVTSADQSKACLPRTWYARSMLCLKCVPLLAINIPPSRNPSTHRPGQPRLVPLSGLPQFHGRYFFSFASRALFADVAAIPALVLHASREPWSHVARHPLLSP